MNLKVGGGGGLNDFPWGGGGGLQLPPADTGNPHVTTFHCTFCFMHTLCFTLWVLTLLYFISMSPKITEWRTLVLSNDSCFIVWSQRLIDCRRRERAYDYVTKWCLYFVLTANRTH